jgi:hypothetical protein
MAVQAVKVLCEYADPASPHYVETTNGRALRKVVGYERHRDAGGTNVVHLRVPQDVWLCEQCFNRLRRGVAPGQAALV